MTPDQIATVRTDLLEFTKHMFMARRKSELKTAPFHAVLCSTLERVVIGDIDRLIINIPPRSGKTEIAVKSFIAWCLGNFPQCEFIHASYSKTLAAANTSEIREIMSHEAYNEVFNPVNFRADTNAKDYFKTIEGGHVYATGTEGSITGFGAGKMDEGFGGAIVIDDPHKAGEANSDVTRKKVLNWFAVTLESRKNRRETPIIVIMQRLHEDDLTGWLLSGGNGEKWHHLNIPAVDADGESFWEENTSFSLEELKRREKANSYVYAGQYMQNPSPVGGGIFKDAWWNDYEVLPQLKYRKVFVDTAQKTKEANDYSVFQCWGYTETGQKYLIDQVRGKWEAPELLTTARSFWNKHYADHSTSLRSMNVEDKVSGTGLIQTLSREGIPVIAIQRNIDKITRAYDAAPIIESRNVYLPRHAEYLSDFMAEASVFPFGKHDDQIDPMMDAVCDIDGGFDWSAV